VIGEELGLVGATAVVGLFVLLAVLGMRIALHAPDRFGLLLAVGVTSWFCVQAFVNIGAVIGILPITGVPLPFISAGGSSLVFGMAGAGLLLSVARQATDSVPKARR
jgi:cell division protein FtsW